MIFTTVVKRQACPLRRHHCGDHNRVLNVDAETIIARWGCIEALVKEEVMVMTC